MSSTQQAGAPAHEAGPRSTGRGSLLLGIAAVGALGCPLLPEAVPPPIRFVPLYLVLPLAICAIVWGLPDLWRSRRDGVPAPAGARIGVPLGAVALVVVAVALAWFAFFLDIG
ncbi:hypothetical protein ABT234_22510 [Streptomyces sp. NPDC001586]|uniref:hypothetical protein n=1 Tax=Streptomyces sp. NPDC001586 TaxID=3154387 RepID=UPI003333AE50